MQYSTRLRPAIGPETPPRPGGESRCDTTGEGRHRCHWRLYRPGAVRNVRVSVCASCVTGIMRLGRRPNLHPVVPRYTETEIRRVPHGNYLIFHRVDADRVVVPHVIHGVCDYDAILFPDPQD
jgi:plasmid stabilization system protein ParE